MSAEDQYIESPVPEEVANLDQEVADSQEASSPKRVRRDDSSVHTEDLPEDDPASGDDLSAASSNDGPSGAEPSLEEGELPEELLDDDGLRLAVRQGLIAFKASLTRKSAQFARPYKLVKIDDDHVEDLFHWVIENLIAEDSSKEAESQ